MSAINNRIYVGSITTPLFYFENDEIMEVTFDKCVDVISEELAIDVLKLKVEHFPTTTSNLRLLPYGTPVWWYVGNDLKAKFYSESIEREEQHYYIVNCISAIGLLDKQYYHGGVYNGELCGTIIEEIIGETVPYSISPEVAGTNIYGYLPYTTCRECLHEIIYAQGISILKDSNGDMLFTYASSSQEESIPQDRIFLKGKIKYPAIPSKINVVEHSYQYVDTVERVTLFDNSDGNPVTGQAIYFDTAPIAPESLQATEGLTIGETNANFASLTGKGILTGIPYYDKQTTITRTYSSGQGFTKTISNRTLVTAVNSENVADRLLSYYTSVENMEADIKIDDESCGHTYSFINKYGESITAFLSRIKGNVSSFVKGSCEFIAGYNPQTFGNVYNYEAIGDNDGYFDVPQGTKILRMIAIGGGDGGDSGLSGENKEAVRIENKLTYWGDIKGCKGGEAGEAGDGGKIKEIIIRNPASGRWTVHIGRKGVGGTECESETVTEKGTAGSETYVVSPNGTRYSSNDSDSYRSVYGIKSLFRQMVYAKKGHAGVKGGDGGDGSKNENGSDGQDVEFNGKIQKGGKGGKNLVFNLHHITKSYSTGGAGGSGAQAVYHGFDGGDAEIRQYQDLTAYPYSVDEVVDIMSGTPASIVPYYLPQNQMNGDGGDAGHGGAGRGGFGWTDLEYFNNSAYAPNGQKESIIYDQNSGFTKQQIEENFKSSKGAAGKDGMHGVCLFYTDTNTEFTPLRYDPPTLSNIFIADDWKIKFTITKPSVSSNSYAIFYRWRVSNNAGENPSWSNWSEWTFIQNVDAAYSSFTYYRQLTAPDQAVEYEFYALTNATKPEKDVSLMSNVLSKAIYRLQMPAASYMYVHSGGNDIISVTLGLVDNATDYIVDITKGSATQPIWRYTTRQRVIRCQLPEPIEVGQTYNIDVYVTAVGYANSAHNRLVYTHTIPQLPRPEIQLVFDQTSGHVNVLWEYDERATSYLVNRTDKDSTVFTKTFTANSTPYVDETVELGHSYYYRVQAVGDETHYASSQYSVSVMIHT